MASRILLSTLRPPAVRRILSSTCSATRLPATISRGITTDERKDTLHNWEKRFGGTAHNFPDYIDKWGRGPFYATGAAATAGVGAALFMWGPTSVAAWALAAPVAGYWALGFKDIRQPQHSIRRNFPVLGNVRYIFETLRPEIRQYFVEGDSESVPFSREQRGIVYQRAKDVVDTMPLGTRLNVYTEGYEWTNHSMWPKVVPEENQRVLVGGPDCTQPYSASLLNVSAMSYGALSDNAILALNTAAKLGGFYHNTGEGGVSRFHLQPGGDIVWNIGTGYFGCRTPEGRFCPDMFKAMASRENIKMIEIKLSQGAKPAHGGILPRSKVTATIAEARGVSMGEDCNSPPRHAEFSDARELMLFVRRLRQLSGGKPVGFKLCVGRPSEFAALVHAMLDLGITPDFITIDGAEGGTGAAPPEFSNKVGMPMVEGLRVVHNMLVGAALRDRVRLIVAGKVLSGFNIVRALALGADLCNSARAMMFALGCVQALKCNTNKCPTGVATQDKELMEGLHVENKSVRVFNFHRKTVHTAMEIVGAVGMDCPTKLKPEHLMKRVSYSGVANYAQEYPTLAVGSLLDGTANHPAYEGSWERGKDKYEKAKAKALQAQQ